jgi:glucosamine--fructose-6-phosphate aminotransferase (isomerizing)
MVGIFGCVLRDGNAAPLAHAALKRSEHIGYDSAGEATVHENKLFVKKDVGRIDDVNAKYNLDDLPGRVALSHMRWATHGAPLKENAHPHVDCNEQIAVVQNGIIENYAELRKDLETRGHAFKSKTDTEVIPHLIEENMKKGKPFLEATRDAIKRLDGSFAIAVVYAKEPDKIVCFQKESSLTLGVDDSAVYVASDIPMFLPMTKKSIQIENQELAIVYDGRYDIRNVTDWSSVQKTPKLVKWIPEKVEKQGFAHFMLKEIHEQPASLRNTLRLQDQYLDLMTTFLDRAKEVFLVACGTSYHACLAASYMFSKMAFLSTHPIAASEFIEQEGKSINIDSIVLAVSQSGETTDTLAAVDYARLRAATILGLTNALGSTLTRVSRVYICPQSGPETAVAATKTFTAQLSTLAQLAVRLAKLRGKMSHKEIDLIEEKMAQIPDAVEKILQIQERKVRQIAKKYKDKESFLFLGRGISRATALEGTLKLLETNYIPSMPFAAGEKDNGPMSLIAPGFPVVFICPKDETHENIVNDIKEVKLQGASVIAIIEEGDETIKALADDYIEVVKDMPKIVSPILCVIPLQLFAYYMAVERELDPDRPRHLTKAVTVK